MKKKICFAVFIFLLTAGASFADTFRFKYRSGEKFRVLSEVDEMLYINGVFVKRISILNKISFEVLEISGNSGLLAGNFQVSEREFGTKEPYRLTDETGSQYWRSEFGDMQIAEKYYMPVVRNVPVFPERNLKVGDTWTSAGEEVHDLKAWGLKDPFVFPIYVNYTYLGKGEFEGKEYDMIKVEYNIFYKPPRIQNTPEFYPSRVSGYSEQILYFDNELGRTYAYIEEFHLVFDLVNGESFQAKGTATAKVVDSDLMNKQRLIDEIQNKIDDEGLKDTNVRDDEEGVTITLSNIQFHPDSSVLIEGEKKKLEKIAAILKKYSDRDIRITGHTAFAGSASGRKRLSIERAQAVGQFLLSLGVRQEEQMIINGVGATDPIADNSTETGKKQNRRVEITILEN